jgi:superfamily II DNA helicase RecQ
MKVKVFTQPWLFDTGGFDDADVEAFLEERTVIDVSEHFFIHEKTPVLVLVLTYRSGVAEARPARYSNQGAAPDASADLTPDERRRYEALRTWRNQYARRTGKPPYVIFTNRQAAELARRAPGSRTQLGEIPGIGESRIEDFGEELLAFMASLDGAALASQAGGGDGDG